MRQKNDIDVLIGGTRYTISGYESTEYITKIAAYINEKLALIKRNTDPRILDNEIKNVLLQINIADDYHKQTAKTMAAIEEKNDADKALFEIKHELMKLTEKVEKLTAQNKQLEADVSLESMKAADALGQLEEEKKKAADALGQLEEEKKKAADALGQLEEEKKKAADALGQLEEEKKKYEDLEKTVDDLLGGAD